MYLVHFDQESSEKKEKKNISTIFLVPLGLVRFEVCVPPYSRVLWKLVHVKLEAVMLLFVRRPRTTVRHSLFYFDHIGHYRSFGDVKLFKMRDLRALTTWYDLISVHGSLLLKFNCIL